MSVKFIDFLNKHKKAFFLSSLAFILYIIFFAYSHNRSVTGEIIEHKGKVIGIHVTHAKGPLGQYLSIELESGKKVVHIHKEGTPLLIGDRVLIIEKLRGGGAESLYDYKEKI